MNNNKTLIEKFSEKMGVEPEKLLTALKATAFKQSSDKPISHEQMLSLLVVANQHGLNPFTKEIYAFSSNGGIIPIVGVDGWARIINENPNFNGIEFKSSETELMPEGAKKCPEWIECIIHRKDRDFPTIIREYLDEAFKSSSIPWKTHTKRLLRHKAMIQCARIAFSLGGIYEEDEAKDIIINNEKLINPDHETKIIPLVSKPRTSSKAEEILINLQNRKSIVSAKEEIVPLIRMETPETIEKTKEELDDEFYRDLV